MLFLKTKLISNVSNLTTSPFNRNSATVFGNKREQAGAVPLAMDWLLSLWRKAGLGGKAANPFTLSCTKKLVNPRDCSGYSHWKIKLYKQASLLNRYRSPITLTLPETVLEALATTSRTNTFPIKLL